MRRGKGGGIYRRLEGGRGEEQKDIGSSILGFEGVEGKRKHSITSGQIFETK
jgi:hypothetical protein